MQSNATQSRWQERVGSQDEQVGQFWLKSRVPYIDYISRSTYNSPHSRAEIQPSRSTSGRRRGGRESRATDVPLVTPASSSYLRPHHLSLRDLLTALAARRPSKPLPENTSVWRARQGRRLGDLLAAREATVAPPSGMPIRRRRGQGLHRLSVRDEGIATRARSSTARREPPVRAAAASLG